jgi:hypothetical protein
MVEKLVMDVQLTHVHAIYKHVQETANGHLGNHGPHAQQNAEVEPKIEQEWFSKLRPMGVNSVRVNQQPLGIATRKNARSTANGVHGVNGTHALKRVVEECKEGYEASFSKKNMEEKHVKETHSKCKDVACKHAQFAKTVHDMPDSAQHGLHIVLTASSSKDVAGNLADCVNMFTVPYKNEYR